MRKTLLVATAALIAAALAGCGGSDKTSSATTTTSAATPTSTTDTSSATPPSAGKTLTVRMSEFAFEPKNATAQAGKVTISAPNDGKVVHELVFLRTNADPAHLPMDGDDVDESKNIGEIADVEPGATKKVTLTLKPGEYAMVCALPGHYKAGMYGQLTVR